MKVKVKLLSHVRLFVTPWTVAYQAPPSMGFSRHECWSGLPFPSPGDLPDPGIEPRSPALQADVLPSEPPGKPGGWIDQFNKGNSENESHSVMPDSATPWTSIVHEILHARILECIAFPFSRGSSQPRDQTQVSHIADGFFTS